MPTKAYTSSHMSVTEGNSGNTIPVLQPAVVGWRSCWGEEEPIVGPQQHIGVSDSSEVVGSTNITANRDTGRVCALRHPFTSSFYPNCPSTTIHKPPGKPLIPVTANTLTCCTFSLHSELDSNGFHLTWSLEKKLRACSILLTEGARLYKPCEIWTCSMCLFSKNVVCPFVPISSPTP